jgi:hypothetical protein
MKNQTHHNYHKIHHHLSVSMVPIMVSIRIIVINTTIQP